VTFFEIIDRLINVDEVPDTKRGGPQYEAARSLIHTELSSVKDVEVACHHEAGHWAQAVLAANQLGADAALFTVIGPTIRYDPLKKNPYDASPTGLRLVGLEHWRPQGEEDIEIMARIAVAGGESVFRFYGANQKRGDANDLCRFKELCRDARNRLGGLIGAPHLYWDAALEPVRKDFTDDGFKKVITAKAAEIERLQFTPVFDFRRKETL
jgi:hypothetical protein